MIGVILKYSPDLKIYFKVTSNWRVLAARQKLNNGKLLKLQKIIQIFIKAYYNDQEITEEDWIII